MYDDGGSSRIIRDAFNMPPPGDLRNILMHMVDKTDQETLRITDVFTHRLSKTEYQPENLQSELDSFILGSHPKMLQVERGLANIISLYLDNFNREKPNDFDLRGASIGNLVMTGCYLLHGRDFENAVYLISSLAKVRGSVVPVTLGNYHLGAELSDGNMIYGQSNITQKNRYDASIQRLFFIESRKKGSKEVQVDANERAIDALLEADLIVYSVGSFYTSILCTLMTNGITSAIKQSGATKIFLANSTSDDETENLTLSKMLEQLYSSCQSAASSGGLTDYINYVIANDHGNSTSYRGIGQYIPVDGMKITALGPKLLEYALEKSRGVFDTDLIARIILSFAHL
jgi:CofD-related protein of GAK system